MDMTDREAEPYFSQPVRQITLMLISLALVGAGAWLAYPRVAPVFLANPYLNGFILLVFVIGVWACFWQVFQLIGSVRWIEGFAARRVGHELTIPPRLLAPLANLLRSRGARTSIAASSTQSILDSVATRIDEAREITRYIVNLLIFLGLLGTFYGLATTVPALVETIQSLAPAEGESGVEIFGRLIGGLEAQLSGMGVAFASSLLGLAGSLVVGLLELFAGHGQNRFYRELEEWLSSITRLGFAAGDGDTAGESQVLAGVLDQMAEQMESLQQMLTQSDVTRALVDEKLGTLASSVDALTQRLEDDRTAVTQLVAQLSENAETQAQSQAAESDATDAEVRMRLRSIDVQLLRILEELASGRAETVHDLRADITTLTDVIRRATEVEGP